MGTIRKNGNSPVLNGQSQNTSFPVNGVNILNAGNGLNVPLHIAVPSKSTDLVAGDADHAVHQTMLE